LVFQNLQAGNKEVVPQGQVIITPIKNSWAVGKEPRFKISNGTAETLTLENPCPEPFFDVMKMTNREPIAIESDLEINCETAKNIEIAPGKTAQVTLGNYRYELFSEPGQYSAALTLPNQEQVVSSVFEIRQPTLITRMFRNILYIPFLNALVGIITLLPNHSLGLAVIILTVIIRSLLLIPSTRALKAQKAMQAVQPELEALKIKYANDQARLAQETMLVWQKHKVHPFSSCLPLLIQIPILIALFHSFQDGLRPDSQQLLYSTFNDFSLTSVNTQFLGLDLLKRNVLVLPIIVAALQFIQMQMMNLKPKDSKTELPPEMVQANTMMKYTMPVMIGVFTAQVPAAVGIYWSVSTFYGILQQFVVNKTPSTSPSTDEVSIKVISKNHGKSH
jgi:YidC/Oxa1 family membrane protein insertase